MPLISDIDPTPVAAWVVILGGVVAIIATMLGGLWKLKTALDERFDKQDEESASFRDQILATVSGHSDRIVRLETRADMHDRAHGFRPMDPST